MAQSHSNPRREELAEAAWRCVAYEGLESATIRGVASEARTSTGRIVHYFRSKDELLLEALRYAGRRFATRVGRRLQSVDGLAAVEALILEELPLDDQRRAEWRVWLAFWSRGSVRADLGEENRRRIESWRELLLELLSRAVERGEVAADLDLGMESERIIAMVNGLGVQAMFAPEILSNDRLDEHVRTLLRGLRACKEAS
jgi:AcrR family transcriptional regulator